MPLACRLHLFFLTITNSFIQSKIIRSFASLVNSNILFHLQVPRMAELTAGFPFIRLPLELRNMVYRELLVMPGPIDLGKTRRSRPSVMLLDNEEPDSRMSRKISKHPRVFGIFLVSEQIRQEAISVYFGGNRFHATGSARLADFLCRIDADARNAIRGVSIIYGTGQNAGKAFDLLAQCRGLRKLQFTIEYRCTWQNRSYGPLLKRLGMKSLLKVRGIQDLNLKCNFREPVPYESTPLFGSTSHSCLSLERVRESPEVREDYEKEREIFRQALQILKEPREQE